MTYVKNRRTSWMQKKSLPAKFSDLQQVKSISNGHFIMETWQIATFLPGDLLDVTSQVDTNFPYIVGQEASQHRKCFKQQHKNRDRLYRPRDSQRNQNRWLRHDRSFLFFENPFSGKIVHFLNMQIRSYPISFLTKRVQVINMVPCSTENNEDISYYYYWFETQEARNGKAVSLRQDHSWKLSHRRLKIYLSMLQKISLMVTKFHITNKISNSNQI